MTLLFHQVLTQDECDAALQGAGRFAQRLLPLLQHAAKELRVEGTSSMFKLYDVIDGEEAWQFPPEPALVGVVQLTARAKFVPDCNCRRNIGTLLVYRRAEAPTLLGDFIVVGL